MLRYDDLIQSAIPPFPCSFSCNHVTNHVIIALSNTVKLQNSKDHCQHTFDLHCISCAV